MHTSAVARDPSASAPPPIVPADHFAEIALEAIHASPVNPRRHFDETYLAQLAQSIRTHGVLEPLVVRQLETESGARQYEIIAGECRYRAASAVGLARVPAMVKTLTDDEALEVRLIENIQRRGLTPLEEAYGYRALIDRNPSKHSAESIAARLGLSPKYVWDRMKLLDLIPAAKQLLEEERLTAGHAILIARQKPADQQRIIDPDSACWRDENGLTFDEEDDQKKPGKWDDLKPISVRELERWIAEHIRFDVTAQAIAAPLDFGEMQEHVQQRLAQPGRGKKVIRITFDHFVQRDARDDADRTFGPQSWKRADGRQKSKPCEHRVLGVVAVGPGYGTAFDVCIAKDKCDVHWKAERLQRERVAKQRVQGGSDDRRQNERERADRERKRHEEQHAKQEQQRAAWQKAAPAILEACAAKLKAAKPAVLGPFVMAVLDDFFNGPQRAQQLLGAPKTADAWLRVMALAIVADKLGNRYLAPQEVPELVKRFGVDLGAVFKAQRATNPAAPAKPTGKRKARR
jgi:ParB family chromosome partitioning protein